MELVGKQPKVECLLAAVCEATGWNYLQARYYYFDKRSKSLSLSRLERVRANIQKVRLKIQSIHEGHDEDNLTGGSA